MPEQVQFDSIKAHSAQAQTYQFRIPYLPKFFGQLAESSGITKESEIMDICCGNGQLAIGLSKYAAHIDAVDGSSEMLRLAPRADNVRYIYGDVNKPQLLSMFSDRKFDHFVLGRAIQWIEAESLRALSLKCLKEKGSIIVASAGWSKKTPWFRDFERVRQTYGFNLQLDWRGMNKLSDIGFHVQDRVSARAKMSCNIQYLANHAASYVSSYEAVRSNLDNFKSDLTRALQAYVQDQKLFGFIESWATIYRR